MLDRESTFADPKIINLLKTRFIPVAIDQANQRRQQDTEGEFYRKLTSQSPRSDVTQTTQGFYIATASGDLLLYNNNRHPEKLLRLMKEKLAEFEAGYQDTKMRAIEASSIDSRYNLSPPKGGLVVRVQAKILDGYEPTDDRWRQIFQSALSRDNLWITKQEHEALVDGTILESLQHRIARFHLVDNTRGEPPMWKAEEIRECRMKLVDGEFTGDVLLQNQRRDRGYDATMRGVVEVRGGKVTRFDMVTLGDFWGEGRYTRGAPKGKFPLAISFTLADGQDIADEVAPQGARGWLAGYLR